MNALEFLKERKRICKCYKHCVGCPLEKLNCALNTVDSDKDNKQVIDVVERWSKENPRKTRQSVFLEQYPEARFDKFGVIQICPMSISAAHRNSNGECKTPLKMCIDCRREFWMQAIE